MVGKDARYGSDEGGKINHDDEEDEFWFLDRS